MSLHVSRREILKSVLASAAAAALQPFSESRAQPQVSSLKPQDSGLPQSFRFVHFSDIHIQHERQGDVGTAQALKAVESLRPKPDFILTGGDLVFDALETPPEKAKSLFELYKKVLADNTGLPVHQTIGNHDVFGWHNSGIKPTDAGYGKAMYKDLLQQPETFQRFDHKGWRFFCLDNIQPGGDERYPYQGFVDGPQFDWLKAELDKTDSKMPIVICEHIPTVTATFFGHDELAKDHHQWQVNNAFVCTDATRRLNLYRSRNVRLSLSGHIHERDRVEFWGTTFINDGAVCGSWWRGPHRGVKEGFGVIDCRADGSFDHQYHEYGWQAKA